MRLQGRLPSFLGGDDAVMAAEAAAAEMLTLPLLDSPEAMADVANEEMMDLDDVFNQ